MTLAECCAGLLSLAEDDWATYALLREPLRGRLTQEGYRHFYERAAACGRDEALQLRRAFPRFSVWEIAAKLDVTVREVPLPRGAGLVAFACFYEPDTIELCGDNVRATQALLNEECADERLREVNVLDLLLAHELFHVLQVQNPDLYVNEKHIQLRKIGGFRQMSRLVSLEDVAAMSFAKEMLKLQVSPFVYDVLMLLPNFPEQAESLFGMIMNISSQPTVDS